MALASCIISKTDEFTLRTDYVSVDAYLESNFERSPPVKRRKQGSRGQGGTYLQRNWRGGRTGVTQETERGGQAAYLGAASFLLFESI